jgi:hypothetical protein
MNSSRRLLTFAAFTWPGLIVGQPVLSLNSASGPIGIPIATSLSISGTTASNGPSALQFALGFQSADFSSVTVAAGPAAAGASKSISCNSATGRVRCVLWGMNKKALSNGVLATVTAVPSVTSSKSSRSISIGEVTSAAMGGASVPLNAGTGGAIQVVGAGAGVGTSTLSSVKCYPNPIGPGASSTCSVVLSGAAAAATVVAISDSSPALTVPASVTIAAGQSSATFAARAGTFSATSTAVLTATLNGVSRTSNLTLIADACPCSIFQTSVPTTAPVMDTVAVELGVKFRAKVAGSITGIRFYKHEKNTGAHVGSLWTQRGELIGRVNFTNETSSGWQTASFTKPIPIAANTTYVASYRSPTGRFSADRHHFATARTENSNLYALRNGEEGFNGVFRYGTSGFPTNGYISTNYWVDVVFARSQGATASDAEFREVSALSVSEAAGSSSEAAKPLAETMTSAPPAGDSSTSALHVPASELARPGQPVSFVVASEDGQGRPSAITPTRLPAGASFDAVSNHLEWVPSADQVGDQTLAFRAISAAGEITEGQSTFKIGWGLPEIALPSSLACSPSSVGKLTGTWLAAEELSDPSGASLELGGTRVRVNGLLAPVLRTHPREIEFQCPADLPGSSLSISVETESGTTAPLRTTMLAANPVILTSQPTEDGALLLRATGITVSEATSGEVKLNGVAAPIQEATPSPGEAGVTTIEVKVPEGIASERAIPVQLEVHPPGGKESVSNSTPAVAK